MAREKKRKTKIDPRKVKIADLDVTKGKDVKGGVAFPVALAVGSVRMPKPQ
jgi:hypothetical protein